VYLYPVQLGSPFFFLLQRVSTCNAEQLARDLCESRHRFCSVPSSENVGIELSLCQKLAKTVSFCQMRLLHVDDTLITTKEERKTRRLTSSASLLRIQKEKNPRRLKNKTKELDNQKGERIEPNGTGVR